METSKVKTITSTKEWTGQNGTTIYHCLIMENGDKINIGKKKKLEAGMELTYELTGGADDQQEYKKAKSVTPAPTFGGGSKYEPKDTGVITMLSCISSACSAVQGSSKGGDKAFIIDMAESFFKVAMAKSTANKPVQEQTPINSGSISSDNDLPF
jgi:hypothetical protein